MKDVAISVENVSKAFKLPHEKHNSIKGLFTSGLKRKTYERQQVLKNVSFDIKKGEFFGIVGRNGSGKSTLLKLISGIYSPDRGIIHVDGKLIPFIELGVGFNPDLTGRENVLLNGALLGFDRKEMDAMYDEIVGFAELEQFMDQKLKNYSSGMQVRLAFSIAIRARGDILVLDEVLAVGDEAFQRKCYEYFTQLKKNKKTVILVTHDMESVKKYCSKAMMIKDGEIVAIGSSEDVANEYSLENIELKQKDTKDNKEQKQKSPSIVRDFSAKLISPKIINQNQRARIAIRYQVTDDIETNTLVYLNDLDRKHYIIGGRSEDKFHKKGDLVESEVSFDLRNINDTTIIVGAEVWKEDQIIAYVSSEEQPAFLFRRTDYGDNKENNSVVYGYGKWSDEQS